MFSETFFNFMFTETRFEFMFSETLFNFMFTGLMSFGNPLLLVLCHLGIHHLEITPLALSHFMFYSGICDQKHLSSDWLFTSCPLHELRI